MKSHAQSNSTQQDTSPASRRGMFSLSGLGLRPQSQSPSSSASDPQANEHEFPPSSATFENKLRTTAKENNKKLLVFNATIPPTIARMINRVIDDYQLHITAYENAKNANNATHMEYHAMRLSCLTAWSQTDGYFLFLQAIEEIQDMINHSLSFTDALERSKNKEILLILFGIIYKSRSISDSFYGMSYLSKITSFDIHSPKADLIEFTHLAEQCRDFFIKSGSPEQINIGNDLRLNLLNASETLTSVPQCLTFISFAMAAYDWLGFLVKDENKELVTRFNEPGNGSQRSSPSRPHSSTAPIINSGETLGGYALIKPTRSQSVHSISSSSSMTSGLSGSYSMQSLSSTS